MNNLDSEIEIEIAIDVVKNVTSDNIDTIATDLENKYLHDLQQTGHSLWLKGYDLDYYKSELKTKKEIILSHLKVLKNDRNVQWMF